MIWHSSNINEVLNELNVSPENGLANGTADLRIETYGKNSIKNVESPSYFKHFLSQLKSKYVLILSVIALFSFVLNLSYGKKDLFSPLLIIAIILFNALINAFQLYKSESALNALKSISSPTATVIRDGIEKQISSEMLVPGDIIILKSGDIIPADSRLIETNNFSCNEYIVTGEDIPVNKRTDIISEDICPVGDRINMVFSGCAVLTGNAKAVVVETGLNTEIGKNSALSQQVGEYSIPIESQLEATEKILNISIFVICFIVFIISIIQNFQKVGFATTTISSLLNAMALAVAAIPEGLPAISMVAIALGIERIIKEDIIIKKVNALEIIGKTSIICSDKTGIITKNSMVVERIFDGDTNTEISDTVLDDKKKTILQLAVVCSTLENDSTETSIKNACLEKCGINAEQLATLHPRVGVIPFDSSRKIMTSINMINGKPVAVVKGAPEVLAERFKGFDSKIIFEENEKMASEGLRVICLGLKPLDEIPANPSAENIENELIFVGLLGINDPPRDTAIDAIKICDKAGIKTVMITGDNLSTAKAVARRVGILKDGMEVISGSEIEALTDDELCEKIGNYAVFARISPNDKLRIISAYQKSGEVVTITGTGFKDAQALSNADIGCAVGKSGTDVARGNADIIINNSHFDSIVNAIKESRGLFANIHKSVSFLLSCNIAEILTYLICLIIFKKPPVSAVQLLWINLITDCSPVIALSTLKAEKDVMNDLPVALSGRIFDNRSIIDIILQALFMTVTAICAFVIGFIKSGDLTLGMTMVFTVIGLSQIIHTYNIKNRSSIFLNKFEFNDFLSLSSLLLIFIVLFLVLSPAGYVFGLKMLNISQILICILLSVSIIPFCEILKLIKRITVK